MTEQTREEALAHFGKKGMKWGVRQEPKPGMSTTYHKGKVVSETPIKGPYPKTASERKEFVERQLRAQAKESPRPKIPRAERKAFEKDRKSIKSSEEYKAGQKWADSMVKQYGGTRLADIYMPPRPVQVPD